MSDFFELLPIIFLSLIVVFFIITIVFIYRQYTIMIRLLNVQAQKRGGTVERKYSTRFLTFRYKEFTMIVSVRQGSRYQSPETKATTMLHKSVPSKISIYRESLPSRISKALGGQDIQISNDEFNREFMIKGDDELFVLNLVDLVIQNKLLDMQHLRPHVLISGSTLDVHMNKVLRTEEQYDQLIDLATAFVDRLQDLLK
jgi:hypothetical protein